MKSFFLTLIALCALSAVVRSDDWTGPKEVAEATRQFADVAHRLQAAIYDVSEDSPLAGEVQLLSKSASRLHDAVEKGVAYKDALKEFRKIERDYLHFEAGLKKAHDVHHDEKVVAAAKNAQATFDRLRTQMSNQEKAQADRATPRP